MDQWLNFKQSSSTVSNYMAGFEKLMLKCDIQEEAWVIVNKSVNGLQDSVKRELCLLSLSTLH